jgi:hypothetical protein
MMDTYLKTAPDSPNVEAVPPMLPSLKAAEEHEKRSVDLIDRQLTNSSKFYERGLLGI